MGHVPDSGIVTRKPYASLCVNTVGRCVAGGALTQVNAHKTRTAVPIRWETAALFCIAIKYNEIGHPTACATGCAVYAT